MEGRGASTSPERAAAPVLIPARGMPASGRAGISLPVTRNASFAATLSGSYIGSVMLSQQLLNGGEEADSVRRKASLTLRAPPSPLTERKLTRTRRMSEAIRSAASPPQQASRAVSGKMRIPTERDDITRDWVRLILNQYMLKHDRPLVARSESILDFGVTNCKTSVGDFSSTYKVSVFLALVIRSFLKKKLR